MVSEIIHFFGWREFPFPDKEKKRKKAASGRLLFFLTRTLLCAPDSLFLEQIH